MLREGKLWQPLSDVPPKNAPNGSTRLSEEPEDTRH